MLLVGVGLGGGVPDSVVVYLFCIIKQWGKAVDVGGWPHYWWTSGFILGHSQLVGVTCIMLGLARGYVWDIG